MLSSIPLCRCTTIYSFTYWWIFELFLGWSYYKQSYDECTRTSLCVNIHFHPSWRGIAGYVRWMFNVFKNCQIAFQVVVPFPMTTCSAEVLTAVPFWTTPDVIYLFHISHSKEFRVILSYGFNFYFLLRTNNV